MIDATNVYRQHLELQLHIPRRMLKSDYINSADFSSQVHWK